MRHSFRFTGRPVVYLKYNTSRDNIQEGMFYIFILFAGCTTILTICRSRDKLVVEVSKMAYLYELEIQSFPNGNECERYGIGIFRTRELAVQTAQRYLHKVKGFRDYYCEYTVRETELVGDPATEFVHTWSGWNVDEDENEVDILNGPVYEYAAAAEAALASARKEHDRQEWSLNRWQIGKCEWTEGFEREYPDGSLAPTLAELREDLQIRIDQRIMTGIEYEYGDGAKYGYPVRVGKDLFLIAVDDDFILNGFKVRRLRDIFEIQDRNGMYQTIAEKEGLTDFEVPDVDITDWRSVFTSLKRMNRHIIVEREYEPDFFRLGIIESVAEDHVVLRHYDADGVWQEPARIEYHEITSVTFDDRYANTFSKYV